MRRRNRNLRETDDALDPYTCHGNLLRARAHKPPETNKKIRTSDLVQHELQFQTPYPTALSQSQVFKLPSSRALTPSPAHRNSPLPLASKNVFNSEVGSKRRAYTRQSNRFLKENASDHRSGTGPFGPNYRTRVNETTNSATVLDEENAAFSKISATQEMEMTLTDRFLTAGFSGALASPFSSRPSSPNTVPAQTSADPVRQVASKKHDLSGLNSLDVPGASDFLSSCPQIHSTTTSPARSPRSSMHNDKRDSPISSRRPSAPTASRPRLDSWQRLLPQVSDPFYESPKQASCNSKGICARPAPAIAQSQPDWAEPSFRSATITEREKWIWTDAAVDFNRPPSQLSFNSDFFDDAQGVSTPLRDIKNSLRASKLDNNQDIAFPTQICCTPYVSPSDRSKDEPLEFSTFVSEANSWITDSIISPPSVYQRRRRNLTYLSPYDDIDEDEQDWRENKDSDNEDELSRSLKDQHDGALEISNQPAQMTNEKLVDCTFRIANENMEVEAHEDINLVKYAESLSVKDAENVMDIPAKQFNDGTEAGKGAHEPSVCVKTQQAGRTRRGTIRASDRAAQPMGVGQTRRNRSGTIVGPSAARRTRSGTIIGPSQHIKIASVSLKARHTSSEEKAQSNSGTSSGNTLVIDGEDDDPLDLFKDEWVDEDWPWIVADPPSPVVAKPRSKNIRNSRLMKGLPLNKRLALRHAIIEDTLEKRNGASDDELLLK
ncbi:hypothetical protein APHAL10511_002242 [Amanita phalloides]|nr:hypothetical protein APHAL10511_002242 [Amanita phalloides]